MKKIIGALIMTLVAFIGNSQSISYTISADTIQVGEKIKIQVSIEGEKGKLDFSLWEGLPIISGPNVSQNFSMINGNTSFQVSYNILLQPSYTGNIDIPPLIYNSEDRKIELEPVTILVVPEGSDIKDKKGFSWFSNKESQGKKDKNTRKRKKKRL